MVDAIHDLQQDTLAEQCRLVAIPAPTGSEGLRAEHVRDTLNDIGLVDVHTDEVGNVLGWLPSNASSSVAGAVVVAAHLDTVFPEDVPLSHRTVGPRIFAPGISDNARGLAAMQTLARVMVEADADAAHPVLFVATVGEEGTGDLRGVKHLFREDSALRSASAFIAVDGPGRERIVTQAIGSLRYRVTIWGAGGHSWGDRGLPNPVHAMGLAISRLRTASGKTRDVALNVGRVAGGTSINSIPDQAWMEVELRGPNRTSLLRAEKELFTAIRFALTEENRTAGIRGRLRLDIHRIGDRPAGETPLDAALVQSAIAATRAVGRAPDLAASSTDANVPISLGIPAVAIGAGGIGGRTHTLDEWYEDEGGPLGIERAALVVCSAAGLR